LMAKIRYELLKAHRDDHLIFHDQKLHFSPLKG
jgi:hypothetical protein